MLVMSSTRFGSMMASTPPGRSPAAAKTAASAVTRSAKPALSSSWRSSATQAPPGSRRARSSGIVAAVTAFPFRFSLTLEASRDAAIVRTSRTLRQASCSHHDARHPRVSLRCGHDSSEGMRLMTRLINIDNGGTLTDFCLVDGGEVRYTKTLTTPYDLSRCLFDGLTKVSELAYGEPRLAALLQSTDCIRYSTTQGTNALVQRAGPQLGLLVTDPTLIEGLAATQAQEDLLTALVGDRWGAISLDADDEALSRELLARVNDLSARGARRLVIAVSGADGADGSKDEARVKGLLLRLYPRHLLGAVPLLFSWELVADPDDIRRTWSGLLNAFLHPAMERFLFNADRRLRDARARQPLRIFRNDGASSRVSKSAALKTYSSGPRGGLEGTRALADHYGLRHLVMVDVGGTTTDVGVVTNGAIHVDRRGTIEHA